MQEDEGKTRYTLPVRIFALETDTQKLIASFTGPKEQAIVTVFAHWFTFFFILLQRIFYAFILSVIGWLLVQFLEAPLDLTVGILLIVSLFVVWYPLLKKYIDWKYDFIYVTTDKIVLVDQSSVIHQKISQMSLENFGTVSVATQFLNLFPFGALHMNLEEGGGQEVVLEYVPNVQQVADKISDAIVSFQRRKEHERTGQ